MRVAVLVLSLLATAAARPHFQPLHHRDLDIVRRANETMEEKPGSSTGPVVTATDESPATTTPITPSSTREEPPTTTAETTPTTRHNTSDAPASTQTPGSSTASTTDETSSNTPSTSAASVNPSSGLSSSTSSAVAASTSATSTVSASVDSSAALSTDTKTTATQKASTTKAPIVLSSRTAKPSATSSSESSNEDKKSSGLPKAALIAIIVVASVIGLAAIIWTLFRKWKLRPSKNFDNRMKPIDFGPTHNDDFMEKSMHDRQRQEFVADLDMDTHHNNSLTAGIPDHDFTAGAAGGAHYNQYDPDPYEYDPYARASPYDFSTPAAAGDNVHPDMLSDTGHAQYDASNHGHVVQPSAHPEYPAVPEPSHATYPPQPGAPAPTGGYYGVTDHPTQDALVDDGYSNLQRGPSVGHAGYPPQAQPFDPYGTTDFSIAGRPTGGVDSPYAQAAAFRY